MENLQHLAVWYGSHLWKHPLCTKTVTAMALYFLGDVASQRFSYLTKPRRTRGEYEFDVKRTLRMVCWATLITTPNSIWYGFLDDNVEGDGPYAVLTKVLVDQLVYSPPTALTFFICNDLMLGKSVLESAHEATQKIMPVLRVNWIVWPMLHLVTFTMVTLKYRVLWINVCSLGWSCFLSRRAAAAP